MEYSQEYETLLRNMVFDPDGRKLTEIGKINTDLIMEFLKTLQDRMISIIDEKEIVIGAFADDIGYNRTVVKRIYKKIREGYSINAAATQKACYQWFFMSVHEFVTGGVQPVPLYGILNTVAECLYIMTPYVRDKVLEMVEDVWTKKVIKTDQEPETLEDIFRERYREFCENVYTNVNGPLGKIYSSTIRMNVAGVLKPEEAARYYDELRLQTLLFLSITSQMPIDYFCVRTYYQHLPLSFTPLMQGRTDQVVIEDKVIQRILEYLISAPQEGRQNLIRRILNQSLYLIPEKK